MKAKMEAMCLQTKGCQSLPTNYQKLTERPEQAPSGPSKEPRLPTPWSWTFGAQNWETAPPGGLRKPPVCGALY